MRSSIRWSAAAMAAGLVIGGLVATTGAAADEPQNPSASVTQNPTRMLDSITGSWGSFMQPGVGGFVVGDDVTSLHVSLPAQLSSRFAESWNVSVRTRDVAQTLVSGDVDASSGSFDVAVPQSLRGFGELELLVRNYSSETSVPVPVTLNAILHVHPELSSTAATIALQKDTASVYGRNSMSGSSPTGARVAPGRTVTITSPAGTWTHGPDGEWPTPGAITASLFAPGGGAFFGILPGSASADGSTVTVRIPKSTFTPYFPDGAVSREVTLQVDLPSVPKPTQGQPAQLGVTSSVQAYLTLVPSTDPATDRIQGDDRYAVAAAVSRQAFPEGADTAFVVTGANYPDALSAGPAAVHRDAPLLLTTPGALPPVVATELERLSPKDVYVVGGVDSVSEAVISEIEAGGAAVHRIGGANRYEASRALAADAFGADGSGSGLVYVATGANFPDALAAGGAAGHADAPVVLVDGGAAKLDDATKTQLAELGVSQIKIAGGPASVSTGIEKDLEKIAPTTRLWGADRISAAVAINLDAYGSTDRAFIVTGYKFPDALAGSAWAGRLGAPLYVSVPDCVPAAVDAAIQKQGATHLTLIGGPASLAPAVQDYVLCAAG